jgi:hypothetical protein
MILLLEEGRGPLDLKRMVFGAPQMTLRAGHQTKWHGAAVQRILTRGSAG